MGGGEWLGWPHLSSPLAPALSLLRNFTFPILSFSFPKVKVTIQAQAYHDAVEKPHALPGTTWALRNETG